MLWAVRHICAYIRGFTARLVLNSGRSRVGKAMRLYKSAEIRRLEKSVVNIGNHARIDDGALLSCRKNGHMEIGNNVGIGARNIIACHEKIVIGNSTILGPNVLIYDHDHVFSPEEGVRIREFKTKPVTIGENCWIGANAVILRGTNIGNNCVVGAGAIVKGNYPDGSFIIQKRETTIRSL